MAIRTLTALTVIVAAWAGHAAARDAGDRLGALRYPHEGAPGMAPPGGDFTTVTTVQADLALTRGDVRVDLAVTYTPNPDGTFAGQCTVSQSVEPGWFGLVAVNAESGALLDETPHCVFVTADATLAGIAHIAAPRVAADASALVAALAFAADNGAPLVLLTGDLTATGAPLEFQALLAALRSATIPAIVTPGPGDGGLVAAYLGNAPFAFRYGADGVLAYSTAAPWPVQASSGAGAALYPLRRELMPSRWVIAATSRYSGAMAMRAQLVLFVDSPLDLLCVSALEDLPKLIDRPNPWGTTPIVRTPPLGEGQIRLIPLGQDEPGEGQLMAVPTAETP